MNIRNKLLIQFTLFVVAILLIFSIGIYSLSSQYRKSDYYSRLQDKAKTTAQLLFNVREVDRDLLKIIDKNTQALYQEKIYVFNEDDELIYSNPSDVEPLKDLTILNTIKKYDNIKYLDGKREVLGLTYEFSERKYVIVISALDRYGYSKMNNLRLILVLGFFIGVLTAIFTGFIFANRALAPISKVVNQVKDITISNLNQRVDEGNKTDEIAQLAITFNEMLQRIEDAFILQRDFVSNAAHELRTPFTVLLTEMEYTLMQDRNTEYYKDALTNLSKDIRKLSKLSNGLLDLARISFDKTTFNEKTLRIDEVLIDVYSNVKSEHNNYSIKLDLESLPEQENQLLIYGNEQLLGIAFKNLIENACKFSEDKKVDVKLEYSEQFIVIHFSDNGIGIPPDDLERIFEPFYRGKNSHYISGYGIGLALTQKIILLHKGRINVQSNENRGSIFKVILPLV